MRVQLQWHMVGWFSPQSRPYKTCKSGQVDAFIDMRFTQVVGPVGPLRLYSSVLFCALATRQEPWLARFARSSPCDPIGQTVGLTLSLQRRMSKSATESMNELFGINLMWGLLVVFVEFKAFCDKSRSGRDTSNLFR